jgi:hypothetical protein
LRFLASGFGFMTKRYNRHSSAPFSSVEGR